MIQDDERGHCAAPALRPKFGLWLPHRLSNIAANPSLIPVLRILSRRSEPPGELALVLTGGGARAAYQVGLLRWLARRFPDLEIPILTGVSAGAMNATFLASRLQPFPETVAELTRTWAELTPDHVFQADIRSVAGNVAAWGARLVSGGLRTDRGVKGLVNTAPLREFLRERLASPDGYIRGVHEKLEQGGLRAVAVSTTSYTTSRSVIWVQGKESALWNRPLQRAIPTRLHVDHVMASAALPIFFPAVQIGQEWYGDGGIGLTAPLSPALHLGAGRILTISTRNVEDPAETVRPAVDGYPPPAQVLGTLLSSVFLDVIDQDVARLERLDRLIRRLPRRQRDGLRPIDLLVMRPSQNLSRLARDFEPRLPRPLRYMSRGLGTRETRDSALLSMIMFQEDYVRCLSDLGESDAEARAEELEAFVTG